MFQGEFYNLFEHPNYSKDMEMDLYTFFKNTIGLNIDHNLPSTGVRLQTLIIQSHINALLDGELCAKSIYTHTS